MVPRITPTQAIGRGRFRLKRMTADLSLDNALDVPVKKALRHALRRELITHLRDSYGVRVRRASCALLQQPSFIRPDQAPLCMRIRKIAVSRVRYAITYLCSAPPRGLAGEHKSMHRLQGKGLTCAIPRGIMVGLPQHSNGCWTRILFLIRCLVVGVADIHCVGYFYAGKPGYISGKSLSGEDVVANLPVFSAQGFYENPLRQRITGQTYLKGLEQMGFEYNVSIEISR